MFMLQLAARAQYSTARLMRLALSMLVIGPTSIFMSAAFGIAVASDPEPANSNVDGRLLYQQIDDATQAVAIGPIAETCGDADFIRRVYLDLTGIIPTPESTRAFLADSAPDKRSKLIDGLLESPEFSRHFAVQLSVLLLDRRTDKYVEQKAWETYLVDAIDRGKPLDQVFRELIYPDDLADGINPARKFLLNRSAEPHAMTRDVGRLFFGMDMQCAQCHDHPLIGDYYQSDYYGLFAFLNRTSVFEDPKSKLGVLAERAEGEAPYESVFTGDGRTTTRPRLPKGATVYVEPKFTEETAYKVKPDKTQAAKPAFSRRALFAERLAESDQFRRNIANRVWALVMGRGLVHPSDFHYSDNPPVNPELLALLADDLASHQFDLRYLIRQVMLSQTYQRGCDPPRPDAIDLAGVQIQLSELTQRSQAVQEELHKLRASSLESMQAWQAALDDTDKTDAALLPIEKSLVQSRDATKKADVDHLQAKQAYEKMLALSESINAADEAAKAAAKYLPNDLKLAGAIKKLETRSVGLKASLVSAQANAQAKAEALKQARQMLEMLEAEALSIAIRRLAPDELARLEKAHLAQQAQLQQADATARLLKAQSALCQNIIDHAMLADSDAAKADLLWKSIVDRWTLQGQVAALKPLTPEQLAASVMRATGFLARSETAAKAAIVKTPPKEIEAAKLTDAEKTQVLTVATQVELLNQLRGSLNQFVDQFGGLAGEEFQATVNQALFLGNSPTVNSWLGAANDTLVGRLKAIQETDVLADELSIAIFSRPATDEELLQITSFLAPENSEGPADRTVALAELAWAMLTSNEFRFNH